jgi:hypothetical protein
MTRLKIGCKIRYAMSPQRVYTLLGYRQNAHRPPQVQLELGKWDDACLYQYKVLWFWKSIDDGFNYDKQ